MRGYIFSLFIFGLVALSCLPNKMFSANFHVILIGDTHAVELKDSINIDIRNMKREMMLAAQYLDYTFQLITFKDDDAVPLSIMQTVKNLVIHKEDIAVFYFTGHGYRTSSKAGSPWPNFAFVQEYEGLDMDDILSIYREKNPSLLLVIADCCNNEIPELFAPTLIRKGELDMKSSKNRKRNYQRLFVETKGEILISGAVPGEFSWSTKTGGLYTTVFLNLLNKAINSSKPSWKEILDSTADTIQEHQNPYYKINK